MQESQETQVQSLGQEDPLEEKMATCSNILAWRIPWIEQRSLAGYSTWGLKESDTSKWLSAHTHTHTLTHTHSPPAPWPNYLPKAPLPNAMTLRIKVLIRKFEEMQIFHAQYLLLIYEQFMLLYHLSDLFSVFCLGTWSQFTYADLPILLLSLFIND